MVLHPTFGDDVNLSATRRVDELPGDSSGHRPSPLRRPAPPPHRVPDSHDGLVYQHVHGTQDALRHPARPRPVPSYTSPETPTELLLPPRLNLDMAVVWHPPSRASSLPGGTATANVSRYDPVLQTPVLLRRAGERRRRVDLDEPRLEALVDQQVVPVEFEASPVVDDDVLDRLERVEIASLIPRNSSSARLERVPAMYSRSRWMGHLLPCDLP